MQPQIRIRPYWSNSELFWVEFEIRPSLVFQPRVSGKENFCNGVNKNLRPLLT